MNRILKYIGFSLGSALLVIFMLLSGNPLFSQPDAVTNPSEKPTKAIPLQDKIDHRYDNRDNDDNGDNDDDGNNEDNGDNNDNGDNDDDDTKGF